MIEINVQFHWGLKANKKKIFQYLKIQILKLCMRLKHYIILQLTAKPPPPPKKNKKTGAGLPV